MGLVGPCPIVFFGVRFRGWLVILLGLFDFCNDRHVDAAFSNSLCEFLLTHYECDVEQLVGRY